MKLPFDYPLGEAPCFGVAAFEALPAEAQLLAAFVVLVPTELPAGSALTSCRITPEGPRRASRVEMTLAGGARRLHLTQYHHDWWRPTLSDSHLARVRGASRAGVHSVYWGRTGQGRAAACTTIGRTQVELTVERGTFVELELSRLIAGLSAALPEAVLLCGAVPFHVASFHIRSGQGPGGLDELAAARWSSNPAELMGPVPMLLGPLPTGWRFEGGAVWPAPPPAQVQWVLSAETLFGPSTVVYARARPLADPQPLPLPPTLSLASGWRQRAQRLGRPGRGRGWFAAQHPELGGWMAAWEEPAYGAAYQLFVRAAALPDRQAVLALVAGLRP